MYKLHPILKTPAKEIQLPTCMYRMPYLYEEFDNQPKPVNQGTDIKNVDRALRVILKRQELLISNLDKLEAKINDVKPEGNHKFTVTNLSSDERVLRQLLERQERLIKNLNSLQNEVKNIIGESDFEKATVVESVSSNQKSVEATGPANVSPKTGPGAKQAVRDICIHADVKSPTSKIRQFAIHLKTKYNKKVFLQTLYHSSAVGQRVEKWHDLSSDQALSRTDYDITFTLVLKSATSGMQLIVNPLESSTYIHGEDNILKHLTSQLSINDFS